jgi:hypothetical protein
MTQTNSFVTRLKNDFSFAVYDWNDAFQSKLNTTVQF